MDEYLAMRLSQQDPKVIQTVLQGFECDSNLHTFLEVFISNVDKCESPIEKMLLAALIIKSASFKSYYFDIWCQYSELNIKENYRCDFRIIADDMSGLNSKSQSKTAEILVECDGHEFHEKTKAQVEYRNNRDLALKKAGYDILHFSGSQIYKNPLKCADEILDYLVTKAEGEKNNG